MAAVLTIKWINQGEVPFSVAAPSQWANRHKSSIWTLFDMGQKGLSGFSVASSQKLQQISQGGGHLTPSWMMWWWEAEEPDTMHADGLSGGQVCVSPNQQKDRKRRFNFDHKTKQREQKRIKSEKQIGGGAVVTLWIWLPWIGVTWGV